MSDSSTPDRDDGEADAIVPASLLEKLKLLPLRERELSTLRQTHQRQLSWIEGAQQLMVRLTNAATIPEAEDALLQSLVGEFGFDISGAFTSTRVLAGDPVLELTPVDLAFFEKVAHEVRSTRGLVISRGLDIEGDRTLDWLMGGLTGTSDAGEEPVVIIGRTRRTAPYYPPPAAQEAGLYRHLLSTVSQVFRSISLQARHNSELERKVIERTRELNEAQLRVVELEREKIAEQMAGGFAHEMRNALSGAKILLEEGMGAAEEGGPSLIDQTANELKQAFLIAHDRLDVESLARVRTHIQRIARNERKLNDILESLTGSVQRALSITTLIMEYSRIGYSQRGSSPVDLVALSRTILAESSDAFAEHSIAATVRAEGAAVIMGDEAHIYSIVKNLVINAFDALRNVADARRRSLVVAIDRADGRIRVRVTDNANGIPDDIRSRIFEPFFTTKPQTGTGLGLGMVQKLVALHDGTIELETQDGRGTTFTVSFDTDNEGAQGTGPDGETQQRETE
jgi:signal transduction histidine kinase